jgi:hypothetical protein
MTRRTIPAQCKGHGRRGQSQDNVARGTPKGRTFGKRRRSKPEVITGIRNQESRQEPCLGSRTTLGRIFGKIVEMEVPKQIVGTSIRLQEMSD